MGLILEWLIKVIYPNKLSHRNCSFFPVDTQVLFTLSCGLLRVQEQCVYTTMYIAELKITLLLKMLNIKLPFDPAIPRLQVFSRELKT